MCPGIFEITEKPPELPKTKYDVFVGRALFWQASMFHFIRIILAWGHLSKAWADQTRRHGFRFSKRWIPIIPPSCLLI